MTHLTGEPWMVGVRTLAAHPLVLAAVLTLANAAKPVLVDDTAYLAFARHLAKNPFEPYGFELFWADRPQPAMEIVLPPVLPYWLALGLAAFGENLLLLKLWLFPFACVLAYSVRSLVRRFVPHDREWIAIVLTVGPGSLPFFNFMLDLPALALQLATVSLVFRGMESPKTWKYALTAGLMMALALQTKYSAIGLPVAVLFAGRVRGSLRFSATVVAIGAIAFLAWEVAVVATHGFSHFLVHTFGYAKATSLQAKLSLAVGLAGHLGLTAGWAGMAALPKRLGFWAIAVYSAFFVALGFLPFPGASTAAGMACVSLGILVLVAGWRFSFRFDSEWETLFLVGWFTLEVLVYFLIAPFPAGRRVLAITVVLVLFLARTIRIPPLAMTFGLVFGILVTALDAWDADAERELPRRAAHFARECGWTGTGYFIGHWGFQYYAEREGMKLIDPDRTEFEPGDWLLLPVGERPQTGGYRVQPDLETMEWKAEFVADDAIEIRTIANLYAGRTPFQSRNDVRLKCELYRILSRSTPIITRAK